MLLGYNLKLNVLNFIIVSKILIYFNVFKFKVFF